MSTSVKARQVCAGMTVTLKDNTGEWITLARHPDAGYWWLHRWINGEWQTTHAHYGQMTQIIKQPGEP